MRCRQVLIFSLCGMLLGITSTIQAAAAMQDTGDKTSLIHYVEHAQLTLNKPVAEVWPAFKDMRKWYPEYRWDNFSGPTYESAGGLAADQVLKLTFVNGMPGDFPKDSTQPAGPQYYIMKTIEVVPEKGIVSVLWGSVYDWKQYTVFYVWHVVADHNTTKIFVDSYGEAELMKPLDGGEYRAYQENFNKVWHRPWGQAFDNLEKLVNSK